MKSLRNPSLEPIARKKGYFPFNELCLQFIISRKAAYKWVERYGESGYLLKGNISLPIASLDKYGQRRT
jgi:hypothetical protein